MRIAPGTILRGKYQIVRKLDERGPGEVFEALHADLAGRYAIKFLCEGGIRNALLLDGLRREALAASALGHPGIVRVYDLDQGPDGSPFLVMEYLNGQDLGQVIRRPTPMALPEVAAIVEAIAAPLGEAHRRGLVHGDLTPENVFVLDAAADTHARLKILDFGVARIRAQAGGVVRADVAPGSSVYAAPERRPGREWEVDARSDVFALGAIAHALVERAPPAVAAAVTRAMNPRPEGRFLSVTDFAQALRAAVATSSARASGIRGTRLGPTPAVPLPVLHPPTARVRLPAGLRKTIAAAAGCGLALLLGVIVFGKLKPAPPPAPSAPPPAAAPAPRALAAPAPRIVPPAPAPTSHALVATDAARQPLPPRDGHAGEGAHHHRSPHAGMTEAARREMEQSYQKATRAFDLGNYDEAIVAYKRTYELGGDAPMLYNIAQALRLGHRSDEAAVFYRRYLDRSPKATNGEEVRARIAELTAGAARPLECHWPERIPAGQGLELSCADADPKTVVAKVFVRARAPGAQAFSLTEMPKVAPGAYKVSLPRAALSPKGLELYFEGRRASGETVAQSGSASHPHGIVASP